MNDTNEQKKLIQTTLGQMTTCPPDLLDEKICSIICPLIQNMAFETFNKIEEILKTDNNPESIKFNIEKMDDQLKQCKHYITCLLKILKYIGINYHKILKPNSVMSLIKSSPTIIKKIYANYRYKLSKYLARCPSIVQELYRETGNVVKLYCHFLNNSIKFEINEDVELIKYVINSLGDIAPLTIYGLNTLTITWKTFVNLSCDPDMELYKYDDIVKIVLGFFKSFGNDILWIHSNLTISANDNFDKRSKFMILFEIFNNLHQSYSSSIDTTDNKFIEDMLNFIIQITGYNFINQNIFIKDWPKIFQDYYSKNEIFKNYLITKYNDSKNEILNATDFYIIGFYIVTLRAANISNEEKLEMALNQINHLQKEILLRKINIRQCLIDNNGQECDTNIYEYTLNQLCFNICKNEDDFTKQEFIILKYLFDEQLWSSLMAFDILRHCYRHCTCDLLLSHLNYFNAMYEYKFIKREINSLAVVLIKKLIIDIFSLLPDDQIDMIISNKLVNRNTLLLLLSSSKFCNTDKLMNFYKQSIVQTSRVGFEVVNNYDAVNILRESPCLENWTYLKNALTCICLQNDDMNEEHAKRILHGMWNILMDQLCKNMINDDECQITDEMIVTLLRYTRIQYGRSISLSLHWPFLLVLASDKIKQLRLSNVVILQICYYLKRSTTILKTCANNDINSSVIVHVICQLLEKTSKIVHQEVLECFDFIVENSEDNDFIMKVGLVLREKSNLLKIVPVYLQKQKTQVLINHSSVDNFLITFSKYCNDFSRYHKCYEKLNKDAEIYKHNGTIPKLMDNSAEERAVILSEELTKLHELKDGVSATTMRKLVNACRLFIENK